LVKAALRGENGLPVDPFRTDDRKTFSEGLF
jgi:hypothetical protein